MIVTGENKGFGSVAAFVAMLRGPDRFRNANPQQMISMF